MCISYIASMEMRHMHNPATEIPTSSARQVPKAQDPLQHQHSSPQPPDPQPENQAQCQYEHAPPALIASLQAEPHPGRQEPCSDVRGRLIPPVPAPWAGALCRSVPLITPQL